MTAIKRLLMKWGTVLRSNSLRDSGDISSFKSRIQDVMGIDRLDRSEDGKKGYSNVPEWVPDMKTSLDREFEDCDYETAISMAGHGRYNNLLILATVFPIISCLFTTSTISFILPSAECDLELTNFSKGLLNASVYICMILTGCVWGFLSDTLGRQKLLVIGFGLDAFFNIIAGLAQNYTVLLLAKFLDGVISAGPYAILMTYLAECNPDNYRASVVQWSGLLTALGTILLPLLAWGVLPLDIQLLSNETFVLNSWRIFLLLCTIPSIISSITFCFRWESPKYLLSKGKSTQALAILRQMYAINTGLTPDSYPVKSLRLEKSSEDADMTRKNQSSGFAAGLSQMKPLIRQPYLGRAILVFLFQFGALLGYNTIRLWLPQLFASIMEAENSGNMGNASTVCDLLQTDSNSNNADDLLENCMNMTGPKYVDTKVYLNSIILGFITALGFVGAGYLTRYLKDITLILLATCVAVVSCIGMYWAISSYLMLAFSSLFVTATSIASVASISVTLQLFPTETRTMAVALVMMFGQLGGTLGNVIFPVLLDWNCTVPFFLLAALLLATGGLVLFLPKDPKKS